MHKYWENLSNKKVIYLVRKVYLKYVGISNKQVESFKSWIIISPAPYAYENKNKIRFFLNLFKVSCQSWMCREIGSPFHPSGKWMTPSQT